MRPKYLSTAIRPNQYLEEPSELDVIVEVFLAVALSGVVLVLAWLIMLL